ncbi:hypothetical protein F4811DRAFT_516859 [Daldinia bambusicola]|nr:hypothetical protein F4811DRAFT_516859 [Daldinia bambusicola]
MVIYAKTRRDSRITASTSNFDLPATMNVLATNQSASSIPEGQGSNRKRRKEKRRSSPNSAQGWTTPLGNSQNDAELSDGCRSGLVLIVQAFYTANLQYQHIVDEYLRWRSTVRDRFSSNPNLTRFSIYDRTAMERVVKAYLALDQSLVPQLLAHLDETSYVDIWRRAAENMARLKSLQKHQDPEHLDKAKNRAIELKNCRVTVQTSYNSVENELRTLGHDSTCEAILTKIAMLSRYEQAYPILPETPPVQSPETPPVQVQETRPVPEIHREPSYTFRMPTLLFIVAAGLVLSGIFMAVAWSKSTNNAPGSTEDADFWIMLQDVVLLFLGLFATIYVARQKLSADPFAWCYAHIFTVAGYICALLAGVLYTLVPTMWSSTASYLANCMQMMVILQLALITTTPKQKQL